ncbi:restriction endonuclease subunit S [Mariniflexile maritimum]|uniref:restriction endonuclease subunit S n=1 Tax=Mariniflexile maritimum TaxID=2682493 RepID=UPI0012F6F9F4|nr:restriction endonuclease subunit S [Mariniflexile maritimum]
MYGLEQEDIQKINTVFKNHSTIEKAILYGSRAKGNYRANSDIDITLVGEKLNLSQQFTIETELDALLLPYKIDLSIFHKIENQDLIDHINRVGIDFFEKKSEDWRIEKLGNIIEVKYGKDHKKLEEGSIPCFGSGGLMRYVNKPIYEDESILIPRKGSLNNIMYQNTPFWTVDTMFWSKINKDIVIPKFLFYQLTLIDYTLLNVGSAVPSLTVPVINDIDIDLPNPKVQEAIAEVLSNIDNKIDLLYRQNRTLESLAKNLFRQWLIEEEKEDWEQESLSSIAVFLNGLACQKYPPKNEIEKLPVLKIRELKEGFTGNSDWASTDVDKKYLVSNGDVIFSWSASLVVKIWDGGDCILNQHLFKVTSEDYPKWFYYLWCKYHLAVFISIAKAHATTMGHIKRGDLDDAMVSIPTPTELEKMGETFAPMIDKIITNNKQIKTLEKTRDTLLPKLMSGEVRVAMT